MAGPQLTFIGGCTAFENRQSGVWCKASDNTIVSGCVFYDHTDEPGSSFGLGGQYGFQNFWALFNTLHSNAAGNFGAGGTSVGTPDEVNIVGNLMYNQLTTLANPNDANEEACIKDRGSRNVSIVDNTIIDNQSGYHSPVSTQHDLHGNIIGDPKDSNGRSIYVTADSGGSSDYNVFEQTEEIGWNDNSRDSLSQHNTDTGEDANSVADTTANIDFVNSGARNYHTNVGSVVRDVSIEHGVYAAFETLYGLDIRVDRTGKARPTSDPWDAGCYQDT